MNPIPVIIVTLLMLAGCNSTLPAQNAAGSAEILPALEKLVVFSSGRPGQPPEGWAPLVIFKHKKPTEYRLVADHGDTVLRAFAASASSGLMQHLTIEPTQQPWLQWRWKIAPISDAVVQASANSEDTPARIILGFDGDKGSLPFSEQILFETARIVTGYDFPYATLMYEWHGTAPAGTVTKSKRSSRIRSLVVEHGSEGFGQWRSFQRNIVEDFKQAYGEMPGKLIGIGVLTDSDSSGDTVEAWYGDIRLMAKHN